MSYTLYSFSPETLMSEGYAHRGVFETEQECDEAAIAFDYYRIELISDFGACVIFESPWA